MASERELRIHQETNLHRVLMAMTLLSEGKIEDLELYLTNLSEEIQAGMGNDEVDAIRERVKRAMKPFLKDRNKG